MKKMLKILGISAVVVILLLVPIFGLYAATVSSLPGHWVYPAKQQSEKVIDYLSAVTPGSLAYFSLLKSQRRYQEVVGLTDKDQDISVAVTLFLDQTKKTLFDIQSVPDVHTRISLFAQHQTFLANARQSLLYKSDELKGQLGIDRSTQVKTFDVDEFQGEQGRLISKRKTVEVRGINEKEPVPESLILSNVNALEDAEKFLTSLIQD